MLVFYYMNEFVVTATRSMRSYAARVVEYLVRYPTFASMSDVIDGTNLLSIDIFASGEIEVAIDRSVRGQDVIIFANCARGECDIPVDESRTELYHAVDALKRSQARNIIVFEPFISSSRSDRTTRRNSVGLWIHFKTLTSLGANHIITYQLHSKISRSMLDPAICYLDDIPALTLLEKYLCDNYIRDMDFLENTVRPHWAFCAVDAGGENLVRDFANSFGAPLVMAHKQRDYSRVNSVKAINILSAEPLEGKVLWIVDDLIDTAGSVEGLIRSLAVHKPKEINIIAVHALFSLPAPERINKLVEEGLLKRIIVADTVVSSTLPQIMPKIELIPSAELSSRIIYTLISNASISKLMMSFNAEKYFKSPNLFAQNI